MSTKPDARAAQFGDLQDNGNAEAGGEVNLEVILDQEASNSRDEVAARLPHSSGVGRIARCGRVASGTAQP